MFIQGLVILIWFSPKPRKVNRVQFHLAKVEVLEVLQGNRKHICTLMYIYEVILCWFGSDNTIPESIILHDGNLSERGN